MMIEWFGNGMGGKIFHKAAMGSRENLSKAAGACQTYSSLTKKYALCCKTEHTYTLLLHYHVYKEKLN